MAKQTRTANKATATFTIDEIGALQLLPLKVLAAVARGEFDLNAAAEAELASRGMDENGAWVGFPKAEALRAARAKKAAR